MEWYSLAFQPSTYLFPDPSTPEQTSCRACSRVSGVRSDQPATGLRNKELSKGQDILSLTWPKSVLCSIQLRGLAGWKGLLSAVCLSLSLSSLSLAKSEKVKLLACYKLGSGTAVSRFPCSRQLVLDRSDRVFIIWSKRIRTFACRYQKPMPYHLAILHTACFGR